MELIVSVCFLHLLAVVSPGPDFFLILRNSLLYTQKIGIWTSVGIGIGILFHLTYSLLGLGWIQEQYPQFLLAIKYAGALYLMYLGWGSLRTKEVLSIEEVQEATSVIRPWLAVQQGLFCNILNPKAFAYFISVFTLVISAETPSWIQAFCAIFIVVTTVSWFSVLSIAIASHLMKSILRKSHRMISKCMGIVLIVVAIQMLY